MLLNGVILPYGTVQEIIQMQCRSFIPVVHSVTPLPQPSEVPEDGPWAVTMEEVHSSRTPDGMAPDYGMAHLSISHIPSDFM